MRFTPFHKTAGLILIFFSLTIVVALYLNPHYPVLVIAGEDSVGTWLSGTLLMMAATFSMTIGMRQGFSLWLLITVFFLLLALDERFMFHEALKTKMIFFFHENEPPNWFYEIPVIAGACVGVFVAITLWNQFSATSRALLVSSAIFGTISVIIDVLAVGVLWEEIFKLLGEVAIVFAMVDKLGIKVPGDV